MLLTIYNLPAKTRYADVKALIYSNCGFKEVILDNLSQCGANSSKVTVGLAGEEDAALLMRKINGLFVEGQQLHVETIKKKQVNQPNDSYKQQGQSGYDVRKQNMQPKNYGGSGSTSNTAVSQQTPSLQQPYYQQAGYQGQVGWGQQTGVPSMVAAPSAYAGMYGVMANQNAFANYGYPKQMPYQSTSQMMPQSFGTYDLGAPLGFNNQGDDPSSRSNQNDWNYAANTSTGNQNSQLSSTNTRWDNFGDSNSRSNRDAPSRDNGGRDARSRDFEQNAPPRDYGRDAPSRDRGRDRPSRDHGRDAPSYDRGRDAPARDRGRDTHGRDSHGAPYRRNEPSRGAQRPNPKLSSYNAPPKYPTSQPKLYGDHVTDPSQVNRNAQKRDLPKAFPSRNKPDPKPAPGKKWKEPADFAPPAKRQRRGLGFGGQSIEQTTKIQAKNTPPKKKIAPEKLPARATAWRCQVAASLAKEMISNKKFKHDIEPDLFVTELKRGLRYRLEQMFGDDYEVRMDEMQNLYREKYPIRSDTDFFNEVAKEVKEHGSYITGSAETAGAGDNAEKQFKNPGAVKAVPSYPEGDKRASKEMKKKNQQVFEDENTLFSQLEQSMQKAINAEFDEIGTLIEEEFSDEPSEQFKPFHERIKTTVIDDYKKTLKINIAKRLLNVGPIMLRIFNSPKMVSRGVLAPALAEYGVTSLRKSEKKKTAMYFGSCETYEDHDRLCAMDPIIVEGSTITIKPFQLVGKNVKMSKTQIQKHRENISQSFLNIGTEETEDQGDEVEEVKSNLQTDNENEAQANAYEEGDNLEEIDETEENNDANEGDDGEEEINYQNYDAETTETEPVIMEVGNKPVTDNDNSKVTKERNGTCDIQTEKDTNIDNTEEVEETNATKEFTTETTDNIKPVSKPFEKRKKRIDDIDMDDVNEDDLEDWC